MLQLTPKLKAKWIRALRSGKYKQGRGNLALKTLEGNRYCCLGVLGIITKKLTFHSDLNPITGYHTLGVCGSENHLVDKNQNPHLLNKSIQYDLADMNDSGKTFSEIADYIEGNL